MRDYTSSPEHKINLLLAGKDRFMNLEYATHTLTEEGARLILAPRSIYFRLRAIPMIHRRIHFLIYLFKGFEKAVKILREYWVLIFLPLVPLLIAFIFIMAVALNMSEEELCR